MLMEQIIKFEFRGLVPLRRMRTPATTYTSPTWVKSFTKS